MDLNGRDVKRIEAFFFELDVLDNRIFTDNNFSHGIGEVTASARISLDDPDLTARPNHNQVTWVRSALGYRGEIDPDRLVDCRIFRNMDERAIFKMGGVQSDERICRVVGVMPQMLFDQIRMEFECGTQAVPAYFRRGN